MVSRVGGYIYIIASSSEDNLYHMNSDEYNMDYSTILKYFEDKASGEEVALITEWKDGKLILRNDPMPVLLKRMERWYSVKFNILDERINDYTYWATFGPESIDQVLNILSLTGPIKFIKLPREKEANGTMKTQEIDVIIE